MNNQDIHDTLLNYGFGYDSNTDLYNFHFAAGLRVLVKISYNGDLLLIIDQPEATEDRPTIRIEPDTGLKGLLKYFDALKEYCEVAQDLGFDFMPTDGCKGKYRPYLGGYWCGILASIDLDSKTSAILSQTINADEMTYLQIIGGKFFKIKQKAYKVGTQKLYLPNTEKLKAFLLG